MRTDQQIIAGIEEFLSSCPRGDIPWRRSPGEKASLLGTLAYPDWRSSHEWLLTKVAHGQRMVVQGYIGDPLWCQLESDGISASSPTFAGAVFELYKVLGVN